MLKIIKVSREQNKQILFIATMLLLLVVLSLYMDSLKPLFHSWFPDLNQVIYQRESFITLVSEHLQLVLLSTAISVIIGVGLAIFVTRKSGQPFEKMVTSLSAIGQTFPPAAVLAIAVPMVGFGFYPAIVALTIYGLLPIIENSIQGFKQIPISVLESAEGMGMSERQRLWSVELPLALPLIIAGIRVSMMINIGTATISATVGAKSLGTPIIAGLVNQNVAYVIQGSLLVALLALLFDRLFDLLLLFIKKSKS